MTHIEFHFNAPDKLAYTCRLLRKGTSQNQRLFVVGQEDVLKHLDVSLWSVAPHEFVSHCQASEAHLRPHSSVILASRLETVSGVKTAVNLGPDLPEGFEDFERLIEVVSDDPADRLQARVRWKQYTALGYTLQRRDLNLKSN
jgi:DNA polymerase-3 subunit chi